MKFEIEFIEERLRLHNDRIFGLQLIKNKHVEEEAMYAYARGARDELIIMLKFIKNEGLKWKKS